MVVGFAIPLHRLDIVLRNAEAVFIHDPEAALGVRSPLLGGLAIPAHRRGVVLPHAGAGEVHVPELILGGRKALFGSLAIPEKGPGIVLLDALADVVHDPEAVLRFDITLGGERMPETQCRPIVRAFVGDYAILKRAGRRRRV